PREWYKPSQVLLKVARERQATGDAFESSTQKKIRREIKATALMALGLMKLSDKEYKVQLIDPKDQCPDIRLAEAAVLQTATKKSRFQEVEVVSLTPHSHDATIIDFLQRTKLSPIFAYPLSTIILCEIEATDDYQEWSKIHQRLKTLGKGHQIYLLRQEDRFTFNYHLAQVSPRFSQEVYFNALHECHQTTQVTVAVKGVA
ncbi:MAG: hypothetical protein M3Q81_02860, partial [bacterium]|nr:hypothetical protein [bacterium]